MLIVYSVIFVVSTSQEYLQVRSVSGSRKTEFDGVWIRRMTAELLTEGVLGLGVVKEVRGIFI